MDSVLSFLKDNGPAILNWIAWGIGVLVAILTVVKAWRQGTSKSIGDLLSGIINAFASAKPPTSLKFLPFALIGLLIVGCAERREDAAISMAKEIALKVVDKANIEQSQLSAQAEVVNPRYHAKGFVGLGAYFDFEVGATGVDIRADVKGAGTGQAPIDQDLREKLFRILANRELSAEQRRKMIFDFLTGLKDDTRVEFLAVIEALSKDKADPTPAPTTAPTR